MHFVAVFISASLVLLAAAVAGQSEAERGPSSLDAYLRAETAKLRDRCLTNLPPIDNWNRRQVEARRELREMLGLDPLPERTDLKPVVTGRLDHPQFTVEKIQFQSRPGLYVTGNLYLPKGPAKPVPAVLYLCGHSRVLEDGVAYGAKAAYQHHGEWFARNGFVCLTIDTLELGEIEGTHHGTYREKMWWWNARGYTPAGVEAWNGIRALDYLQSRPEADPERLGVTGRSGGGAYSWWIAALDERVKAAAPVAGITDLWNHVVDGCVEGHCDCMYIVNTYRWDYPEVAALVAPRPLLIGNSDKDSIFPLDGVVRLHEKVRRIYRLYGAADKLGLLLTEGPHKDTQDLQLPVFRWFNRFLKGEDTVIETAAVPLVAPEQLKVFETLPADQHNTRIHETFVPAAPAPALPASPEAWNRQRDAWLQALRQKVFAGWPETTGPLGLKDFVSRRATAAQLHALDFNSQEHVPLRMFLALPPESTPLRRLVVEVMDETIWRRCVESVIAPPKGKGEAAEGGVAGAIEARFRGEVETGEAVAWVATRGIGPGAWPGDDSKQTQIRRRFQLLGQTLDGMRVWDVRRALQALRREEPLHGVPVVLRGQGQMAGIALYAALFEPGIAELDLTGLPASHREGTDFLNVLKVLDLPQAVAMAAERCPVRLRERDAAAWEYPIAVARRLEWGKERVRVSPHTVAEVR